MSQRRCSLLDHAHDANDKAPWPVAVFAHNEESHILACLKSVAAASATHSIHAYVLANGCSDSTQTIVRNFASDNSWVTLIPITVGDKANAWNVFVHEVATPAEICFFIDGDVQVEHGSFDAMFRALQSSPDANAAAAIPSTGRSKRALEQFVCERHLILGNLYALRWEFVVQARRIDARIPIGYIGEDGLVTSLVKWNLDPLGPFLHKRVAPCPSAHFAYRSFSPWVARDWRVYWRRRVRYSLRHFQHELLVPLLKADGVGGLPHTVSELYKRQRDMLQSCTPRYGADIVFDSIALREMRRQSM